jgi:sialate O-acetylesterase
MKCKSYPSIGLLPVGTAMGMLLALLAAAPAAVAQTTYIRDINGSGAGFGTALGTWDTTAANWTTDATGVAAPIAWLNDASTPNSAILDFVGNTGGPGALTLATDLNLGGLEVKGLGNSTSGHAGPVLAINESRTITFGAGAVVTIEDRGIFLSDLNIRALANNTTTTTTLNLNGFTKAGTGNLQLTAQAQGATAGATAVVNLTGTVNVEAGQLALVTVGANSGTTRTINVGSAVFNLAPGTVLSVMSPFSYTGAIPVSGTAAFGEISGSGTVRGERNGASNTLTLTATGITPGTDGTIGTLTIADSTGTNTLNQPADGATGFSFASLATGGLKFDLAAPGSSDRLAFSGLSTVNLAGLAFRHFDFNQLAGFGAGTYTLVSGLPSMVEGSLGETTGTIGGRAVTLAINGSSLELTVGGAGSGTTAPAAPSLTLLASSDTGSSSTDRITNDTTPTLRITLAGAGGAAPLAGDVVKLRQAGVEVASATLGEGDITAGYIDLTSAILAPGSLSFTATVTDDAGSVSAPSEALGVLLDTTAPVISVIGSDASVVWGSGYSDEGATATDPEGGAVAVVTVNPVDTSTPGVYTVTYRATDAAGNTALATRTVTVSVANSQTPAFARIFRDNAVLQRGKKLPIWGFAPPGQQLTVRFGNQSVATVADPGGSWQIELEPLEASFEPERLILTGASGETLQVVEDLLVGEVWVLGGQSNMAWFLKSSDGGEAAATQANYPWLRVFDPGSQLPNEPARDAASGAKWTVCTPQNAGNTSAIGFWFAEALYHQFQVPVGLVQTAVSGSYGESWVPREVLEAIPEAQPRLDEYQAALEVLPQETERWEAEKAIHDAAVAEALEAGTVPPQPSFFVRHGPMGPNHFQRPYALFNGRIAPVAPFAARGVVWYQGEGNTQKPRAPYYDDILRGLLTSWREAWSTPELPFIIVQLPRFVPEIHNDWPMVREKQFEVAQEDPHTGLVTTIDLGDPNDIHPRDKEPVAERVTRLALSLAYGQSGVATGPLLQSVSQRGESFQLTFSQTGEGLRLSAGDTVKGFVFETETGATLSAEARLTGPDTVTLTAPESGATPVRIRYAAENLPDINLINSAGLPAAPFSHEVFIAETLINIDIETGNAVLTFALKARKNYLVQSSEDLATWNTWSLNVPVSEFDRQLRVIDDGTHTNSHPKMTRQRFYRLIQQTF